MFPYVIIRNLLILALELKIAYQEANPDVGMGKSKETLLHEILEECGIHDSHIPYEMSREVLDCVK